MANKINTVPAKRPETETPTVTKDTEDREAAERKKMEHMADRAAHKAADDERRYDEDHTTISE